MHVPMCRMCGVAEINEHYTDFCSAWCEQDYLDSVNDIPRKRYEAPSVTEGGEDNYLDNYYESQYEGYDEV
jgi:hypothetical protein